MTITQQAASITAKGLLATVGVNTHIDFGSPGYSDLAVTAKAINFLGILNIRDCPNKDADVTGPRAWSVLAGLTGAKFDPFIGETGPDNAAIQLARYPLLALQGIVNLMEGANEWDSKWALQSGGNLQLAAQFQTTVYNEGLALGLPVVNISFGAGWTSANNWEGNYGSQGDLRTTCDYANAHTYPQPGQKIIPSMARLIGLAGLAASGRQVITSEIGFPEAQFADRNAIAKYCLLCIVGGIKLGSPRTYFYSLFDDVAGKFGIMNSDGTPKPAGQAISNFLAILKDPAQAQLTIPTFLAYEIAGIVGDDSLLCQKSDGTFQLIIWDEVNPPHNVIVNLGAVAKTVRVFDPIKGTSPISTFQSVSSVTINLADYPIIIDIDTDGVAPTPVPTPVPTPTPTPTPTPVPGFVGWITPAAGYVAIPGRPISLDGISYVDDWALHHAGTCALNLSVSFGALIVHDATGGRVAGSGTTHIKLAASLAKLNDFLTRMSFVSGGAGNCVLTLDMWNQSATHGVKKTVNIAVS